MAKPGRPPLPPNERRENRVVVFFNDDEIEVIDESRGEDKRGPFCRECVLEKVGE